jgi:polyisoprenoid-binding protein YceI
MNGALKPSMKNIKPSLATLFPSAALLLFLALAPSFNQAQAAGQPPPSGQPASTTKDLPTPGTYKIDPRHSFAYFSAWHHLVGRVRGRFNSVNGTIVSSPDPAACSVDVVIDAATIDTQVPQRDEDLRSPAYFEVAKFPSMTYQGRGIHRTPAGLWQMDGSLTIHGVTKVVPIIFQYNGVFADPNPKNPARVAFHANAATKRAQYGMGARDNKNEVGDAVEPDVDIQLDVEADATPPTH